MAQLCCYATQATARLGNVSGMSGVALGITAAIGSLDWAPSTYVQLAACLGIGGGIGYQIAARVSPNSLPETVAAFHSLVGFAAVFTAVGDYLGHASTHPEMLDGVRLGAIALATVIGGVTEPSSYGHNLT
jgi:NAD(P) transhydrogenase